MTEETVDDWLENRRAPAGPTKAALRKSLVGAPEAPPLPEDELPPADDLPPTLDRAQGGGRGRGRPRGEIFADCPVMPLGVYGDVSYYLDVSGQLRQIDNHSQDKIRHVFGGRIGLLSHHWPQYDKQGAPKPGKFDQGDAATAMVAACEECGVWSPTGRVRGAGCWTDDDGQLIFHAGDEIWHSGKWHAPGVIEGKVYPASDRVPRPATTTPRHDPAPEILLMIETWQWRRPDIDPVLALGAICAQMLGGALDWRPVTWLTGDQATGKSTFQKLLKNIHGGAEGLLQSSDATEAGIRSVIGFSSLPVALDELEPDDDPKRGKAAAIIRLARIAASGDQILRGSTDQKGYQGNAFSCFIFSSILVPPLPPQDRSRLILLDLDQLQKDARKPEPDWRKVRGLGAGLRRRLLEGWATWPARLDLWRAALAAAGHGGRHADNYGTVLAMADMALSTTLPDQDALAGWVDKLAPHLVDETFEVGSNAEDMLTHLMGQPLDVWRRGQKHNVATWVAMAARLEGARDEIESANTGNANEYLAQWGMRVEGRGARAELAIANKAINSLANLFEGTPWANGVWKQAARRIKDARPSASALTMARVSTRATWIPLRAIPGMLPSQPADPAPHPAPPPYNPEDFA